MRTFSFGQEKTGNSEVKFVAKTIGRNPTKNFSALLMVTLTVVCSLCFTSQAVANEPPTILSLSATALSDTVWLFTGVADDDQGSGDLVIEFTGMMGGISTTTASDGSFSLVFFFDEPPTGYGSAIALDSDWTSSDPFFFSF